MEGSVGLAETLFDLHPRLSPPWIPPYLTQAILTYPTPQAGPAPPSPFPQQDFPPQTSWTPNAISDCSPGPHTLTGLFAPHSCLPWAAGCSPGPELADAPVRCAG